jgi:hypothetical protein
MHWRVRITLARKLGTVSLDFKLLLYSVSLDFKLRCKK